MTLHLPDVSEFQPSVNWAKVNKWNGGAAIIRAAYGTSHIDKAWFGGQRRADFWSHDGAVLGIYQYLVADQSPVAQAKALRRIVGTLQPGEFLVCDDEEGGGNQSPRFRAWAHELKGLTYDGYQGHWLYSSDYFFKEHLSAVIRQQAKRAWVAAYGAHEPTDVPHTLWQYTSTGIVPGIPTHCDVSQFNGTLSEFATLVHRHAKPKPTPDHKPVLKHPFAELRVDGDLGPLTIAALNYALGVPGQGTHISGRTIRALQHRTGAPVDGEWGKHNCGLHSGCKSVTTQHLQAFLNAHGAKPKVPTNEVLGAPTIKGLQRFLNVAIGRYAA